MKTIAIDFDGVIHEYKNFAELKYEDKLIPGALEALKTFLKNYNVIIFSARPSPQIIKWMQRKTPELKVELIPPLKTFWDKKGIIGVTNRKIPSTIYIDDRGYRFGGDWKQTLEDVAKLL